MSSASLVEKRSLRKSQSRNIGTSSTSITSAPPTTSESKKYESDARLKDKSMMRSKQRDSLPDIAVRKGNRSVRASNFELSSSANDFDSNTNHERQMATKSTVKSRTHQSNAMNKSDTKQTDDNVLELLKMDSMAQENYKLVFIGLYCDSYVVYLFIASQTNNLLQKTS